MEHWKLTQWCTYAVSKIKYPPDRQAVYDELRQHVDDRCDSFLDLGLSKDEAVEKTVEVMGDPRELAPYLGAIHRPFWGYAYSITKWALRLTAIITAVCVILGIFQFFDDSRRYSLSSQYYEQPEDSAITRTLYLEPNCSATSDGYTFTVTRIAAQHYSVEANIGKDLEYDVLYVELKVSNYLPWAYDCEALGWFRAVDSLGKRYGSYWEYTTDCLSYGISSSNPFVQYYDFCIPIDQLEEMEWIELRYNRSGRDIALHIDLTGGEGA